MCSYFLAYDTRVLFKNNTFYFRKGIWNTTDGIINILKYKNAEKIKVLLLKLQSHNRICDNDFTEFQEDEMKIFTDLINSEFIVQTNSEYSHDIVKMFSGQNLKIPKKEDTFILATDIEEIKEIYLQNQKILKYNFETIRKDHFDELSNFNFFSKVNSIEYEEKIMKYRNLINKRPVIVMFQNPNIAILRNLNRICEESPMFIGLIDGPFMIFLAIQPKLTACWECFESRMNAFIKDHILYNEFLKVSFQDTFNPILNLNITQLIHMSLQEVITWTNFKMSKFMGRVMYTYLPTYEIHIHDINRLSSCKSCGYISKQSAINNNLELNRLILEYSKRC